jgi:polyisoprenoid-binding protein YceI
MKKLFFLAVIILLSAFTFLPGNWEPVPDAKVNFSINGMFGIDVNGTVADLRSEINFHPDDLLHSVITATVGSTTINTKNKKRDNHLRSADFLNVEKYPSIRFVSTHFRKIGEYYVVEGDLTLKGVTKKISIPFEFTDSGSSAIFTGEFDIDRVDFGVG